jgi:hypothetical protein
MTLAERLAQDWKSRLEKDCPDESPSTRQSVVRWLLGDKPDRFDTLNPTQLAIATGAIDFLYRILLSRYLGVPPEKAYRNLIGRLGGLVVLRQKILAWVSLSRDRQRTAVEVLQEVIQEMLNSDRYLQQQVAWIAECTSDRRLRNSLLLASVEVILSTADSQPAAPSLPFCQLPATFPAGRLDASPSRRLGAAGVGTGDPR